MSRADKYEKIERIGEGKQRTDLLNSFSSIRSFEIGTYGTVYKARCVLNQEIVALKKVRLDDEDDVRTMERNDSEKYFDVSRVCRVQHYVKSVFSKNYAIQTLSGKRFTCGRGSIEKRDLLDY